MYTTITPAEMKELETRFMQETGTPGILLMEHAALGIVDALARHVPKTARVLFLCGPGNNGGDGYAAARLWEMRGGESAVWELTPDQKGDALLNRRLLTESCPCIRIHAADEDFDWSHYDAYVDAMFGTGLTRPIEGWAGRMLHAIYDECMRLWGPRKPVIAVDIPSGLDGLTGVVTDPLVTVPATETVTFHRPKQGLLLNNGPQVAGKITVCPILIPDGGDLDMDYDGLVVLAPDDLTHTFERDVTVHKGDLGRVVIFCGSQGMAGAAALCANAAMRTGAGLTNILCRASILPIVQTLAPGATCTVLPEKDGALLPEAIELARRALDRADAACIGCGMGQGGDVLPILRLFAQAQCPVIWDADSLSLLSRHDELLPLKEEDVITPHFGEAARLLDGDAEELSLDPLTALDRLHELCGCTVLLKGARTLITDGQSRYCNLYATPAMAKGGSGDVLTGIITALLARDPERSLRYDTVQESPTALVAYGALIHGLAGIRAEKLRGENSVLPTDLIDCIRLDAQGLD